MQTMPLWVLPLFYNRLKNYIVLKQYDKLSIIWYKINVNHLNGNQERDCKRNPQHALNKARKYKQISYNKPKTMASNSLFTHSLNRLSSFVKGYCWIIIMGLQLKSWSSLSNLALQNPALKKKIPGRIYSGTFYYGGYYRKTCSTSQIKVVNWGFLKVVQLRSK